MSEVLDATGLISKGFTSLTARKTLYVFLIAISLVMPGMTYTFIFHRPMILLDLPHLLLMALTFSAPFWLSSSCYVSAAYMGFMIDFINSNHDELMAMKKSKRIDTVNKVGYHYFGTWIPSYALVFFYFVLVFYYFDFLNWNFWSLAIFETVAISMYGLLTTLWTTKNIPKERQKEAKKIMRESDLSFIGS